MESLKVPIVFTTSFSTKSSPWFLDAKSRPFLDRVIQRFDDKFSSEEQYRLMVREVNLMDNLELSQELRNAVDLRDRLAVDAQSEKNAVTCSRLEKIHKMIGCSLKEIPSFYKLMLINQTIFVLKREMIERNIKVEATPPPLCEESSQSSIIRWLKLTTCCWSPGEMCNSCKFDY